MIHGGIYTTIGADEGCNKPFYHAHVITISPHSTKPAINYY